jgi:hypothetical protein
MRENRSSSWGALGLALLLAGSGCASKASYLPSDPKKGSINELSRKQTGTPLPAKKSKPAAKPQIVLLVSYDATGKPVIAELRESSGDPALDQRAIHMALHKMTFPAGHADTVLVPIAPKSVPKK